jgi:hypothetical protein
MVDGPFDAINSIGMFEHVGLKNLEAGDARARIWRLCMAAWALNFDAGEDSNPPGALGEERRKRCGVVAKVLNVGVFGTAQRHTVIRSEDRLDTRPSETRLGW